MLGDSTDATSPPTDSGRIFLWNLATGACSQVLESTAPCRDGAPTFRLACEPVRGAISAACFIREAMRPSAQPQLS